MRRTVLFYVLLSACSYSFAAEPRDIGSRRELFVDVALVEQLIGRAELRLHHPIAREAVIVHDAPWEGNATAYHSVFQDGELYRMYYRAWRHTHVNNQLVTSKECLCYAESDDGIRWRKPNLGLHPFQGSTANNIVISAEWAEQHGATVGGPAVFRDENPDAPPESRYKTFLISNNPLGMRPFQSPDGIHWSAMTDAPTITDGAFDSQNLAFWDSHRREYRAYWRYFTGGTTTAKEWKPEGIRAIRTATSKDFRHWERQADLSYVDSPEEQLYENGVIPYHRAPHLFLGFPVRYIDRGSVRHSTSPGDGSDQLTETQLRNWPTSLRALPDPENRDRRAKLSERYGSALTEGLFMASRDGVRFKRWNDAFLPPGIQRPGTWNYGHLLIGWRMVETRSHLDGAPNELSLYATEGYSTAPGTSLRRYTLRLDGFVSAHAPRAGGELITTPVVFTGNQLRINFSTSAAGLVRVEIQSAEGEPLPGFSLADCHELFGDELDRRVIWKGDSDLGALAGKPVRLRFELQDADVYSFRLGTRP
ncbi:MAG: hypothetical protein NT069_34010 [Planctomycetota bacterium]|nr:hypothetical protein [Planctomycetota bacterium]